MSKFSVSRFPRSAVLAACLLMGAQVHGQCGPSGCAGPDAGWSWVEDGRWLHLYQAGRQVGSYEVATRVYRPLLDSAKAIFGVAQPSPVPPPERLVAQNWQSHGVQAEHLASQRVTSNGKEVAPHVLYASLTTDAGLEDDTGKLWLVVIGKDKARRKAVLKDLEQLPEFKAKLHTWDMPPDDFHALDRDTGKPLYRCSGDLSLYLMDGRGKVYWRQDEYAGPHDLQALRKADPQYDPAKDPSPESKPGSLSSLPALAALILVLASLTSVAKGARP